MAYYSYVKQATGQGQRAHAVTEWAHCQRQVAFFLWLTTKMQIKVHNVVLYRHVLWQCTTQLCTDQVVHKTILCIRYEPLTVTRWCTMVFSKNRQNSENKQNSENNKKQVKDKAFFFFLVPFALVESVQSLCVSVSALAVKLFNNIRTQN